MKIMKRILLSRIHNKLLAVKVSMEVSIKNSINRFALVLGGIIAIQGIGLNFIISLAISIALVFAASSLFGQPIRNAIKSGVLTKQELQKMLLVSPYCWGGVICFILLVIIF
tara:strand:+ start:3825 stop:4160 length:336 start_codon:yes stop_codon:yes gene_type:complete